MTIRWVIGVLLLILVGQAIILYLMGQPSICGCGYIKAWEGVILSPGNSQHLTDWYTFSHIIHGIIFFYALGFFFPRLSVSVRLIVALGIEMGWEILENTPMVINHYRQQALAQGYMGDSVLNSVSDSLAMLLGFLLAWRVPILIVVGAALGLELLLALLVRDNFTLNVINLIYQFPAIEAWQAGG